MRRIIAVAFPVSLVLLLSGCAKPAAMPDIPAPVATVAPVEVPTLPPALTKLALPAATIDNIQRLFRIWLETEWLGCLYGRVSADTVVVQHMELAKVETATQDFGWFKCRPAEDIVGTVHPHTNDFCGFSPIDDTGRAEWSRVDIVICRADRIVFRFDGGKVWSASLGAYPDSLFGK